MEERRERLGIVRRGAHTPHTVARFQPNWPPSLGAPREGTPGSSIQLLLLALPLALACHSPSAPRERVPDAAVTVEPPAASVADAQTSPRPVVTASSSAATARPVDAPPVSAGKPGLCFVELTSLLSADIFRGVRRSPSRDAARARLSSKTRGEWEGRDHALTYLQCRYAVRLNGKPYTYEHVAGQGFGSRRDLDTKTCDTPMEKDKVAKQIVDTTKQCKEPHAGAYWGFDLVEVTP